MNNALPNIIFNVQIFLPQSSATISQQQHPKKPNVVPRVGKVYCTKTGSQTLRIVWSLHIPTSITNYKITFTYKRKENHFSFLNGSLL